MNKSINDSHQQQNKYMEAKALNYKGIVESHARNYNAAFKVWMDAIRITEKLGNYSTLICIYFNLSSLFLLQNSYEKAYDAIRKSFALLEDDSNPIQWSEKFHVLFHNYIICCDFLRLELELKMILEKYPQYDNFYQLLSNVYDRKSFLCDESMNYYGIDGYSFL